MTTEFQIIFFILLVIGLLIVGLPARAALTSTHVKHRGKSLFKLRNHGAAWGIVILFSITFFTGILSLLFTADSCSFALLSVYNCNNIPQGIASWIGLIYSLIPMFLVVFGFPALLLYLGAEIVTRRREKKANPNA